LGRDLNGLCCRAELPAQDGVDEQHVAGVGDGWRDRSAH